MLFKKNQPNVIKMDDSIAILQNEGCEKDEDIMISEKK
jgi:hypothetical protein